MKLLFILIVNIISLTIFGQVGINTNIPQQTLHIGGSNSKIRVNGLNSVNNSGNNGLNNSQLFVDANGDLKVKSNSPSFVTNLLGTALIPSSVLVRTNTGASNSVTISSGSFTIGSNSWTSMLYEVGVIVQAVYQSYGISDGAPREITLKLFIDGTEISNSSTTYVNINNSGNIAAGLMVLSNSIYKYLTAGTHTYSITGTVYGGSYSFDAYFGGSPVIDRFQVLEFN